MKMIIAPDVIAISENGSEPLTVDSAHGIYAVVGNRVEVSIYTKLSVLEIPNTSEIKYRYNNKPLGAGACVWLESEMNSDVFDSVTHVTPEEFLNNIKRIDEKYNKE